MPSLAPAASTTNTTSKVVAGNSSDGNAALTPTPPPNLPDILGKLASDAARRLYKSPSFEDSSGPVRDLVIYNLQLELCRILWQVIWTSTNSTASPSTLRHPTEPQSRSCWQSSVVPISQHLTMWSLCTKNSSMWCTSSSGLCHQ